MLAKFSLETLGWRYRPFQGQSFPWKPWGGDTAPFRGKVFLGNLGVEIPPLSGAKFSLETLGWRYRPFQGQSFPWKPWGGDTAPFRGKVFLGKLGVEIMPRARLELARTEVLRILSPVCLPIPPPGQLS